jgi:hypothetical protein
MSSASLNGSADGGDKIVAQTGSSNKIFLLLSNSVSALLSFILIGLVAKHMDYGSYFWWEAAILFIAVMSTLISILGILGFFWGQLLPYFSFFSASAAYIVLFIATGTLAFPDAIQHYVRHDWDGLQMYFPEFQLLNTTEAIGAAQDYVFNQSRAIGVVSVFLFLAMCVSVYFVTMLLTWRYIATRLLTLLNLYFGAIGIAVICFGAYVLNNLEMYGSSPGIGWAFVSLGILVILVSFGGIVGAQWNKDNWLHAYIICVASLLLLLVAGMYAGGQFRARLGEDLDALTAQVGKHVL